ncbi:hypothetical protein ENUP19_0324G0014 [Entamoeba nuttalli]|uniref:Uncharacterized protein n=2 Tax=Entamoeba nuttalli TaxID=412467 RepID=K2H614_ENTNP|nr:hypothetical protein ENU1_040950 [Entamoeba nuttalli P19]EKE41892.1 hypothetical protein ENU1_040950 [Entamoeba nuttalli P19]|eukprot:XP_008855773.1 hypothetical protein ENU1_040950 [Entamoeba nuttalli P19]
MEQPVIQIDTKESKPLFKLSNYRMTVHALLLTFISCIYGGVPTIVLLVIGGIMIYDNINKNAFSIKASIPFIVLTGFFFLSLIVNFISTMDISINTLLIFFTLMMYVVLYLVCIMFNFNLVKEFNFIDKKDIKIILNIMSSTLGFISVPVTSYAITHFIPSLELYVPLLFVFVHLITSPNGDDPILISFSAIITLIASVFSFLELGQLYIIMLPMSMYLLILTPHLRFLALASAPMFVASCTMLLSDNMLYFTLVGIITVIFVLTTLKRPNIIECTVLCVLISLLSFLVLSSSKLNTITLVIMSLGIGLIAFRIRFNFDLIVFISIGSAVVTLFMYLHTSFHHIYFHITRFIIFNINLHDFTIIYAIFATFTLLLPYLMVKTNRTIFSVLATIYSFGLATIEYIVASRRNGIFYNDTYCVFTGVMLCLIGYLMYKTKKIYLTSFAIIISFQIAKLSMFIFPRYLSIFSIAVYLSTIIIRQSYHPDVAIDTIYFLVNQIWNALTSLTVSATFISTLHVIYFNEVPTYVQTLLEAFLLMCILATHECYVLKNNYFVIPFTGLFGSALGVLLSLGADSSLDQLIIFFIVGILIFTSTNYTYSIAHNFLTRLVFIVSLSFLFAHYMFGYLPIVPSWFFILLLVPSCCGVAITMETIFINQKTITLLLPLYSILCISLPLSFAGAVITTLNLVQLRSIASVVFSLHFTLHVAVLIANNISQKQMIKKYSYNTMMTIISGPWSIIMGIFLHYFVLNGSSISVLIFVPILELIIVEKFVKLEERKRSGLVLFSIIIILPILTLSSILKYGFNIYVLTTYIFIIIWNVFVIYFALFLFTKKEIFQFPIFLIITQFVVSILILCFTTNDLMFTQCVLVVFIAPIAIYMQLTNKAEQKDSLVL